jgi:hypothetical protein
VAEDPEKTTEPQGLPEIDPPGYFEGESITRRRFMEVAVQGVGGVAAAGVALPALGFAVAPMFERPEERWLAVGGVDQRIHVVRTLAAAGQLHDVQTVLARSPAHQLQCACSVIKRRLDRWHDTIGRCFGDETVLDRCHGDASVEQFREVGCHEQEMPLLSGHSIQAIQ